MIRWLAVAAVRAMHGELIAEHGGVPGVRDEGALEAACARPQQIGAYTDEASLFELAAACGHGLARKHPFVDGNKRVALMAVYVSLRLNGYRLTAPEAETVGVIEDLAAGEIDAPALAQWLEAQVEQARSI